MGLFPQVGVKIKHVSNHWVYMNICHLLGKKKQHQYLFWGHVKPPPPPSFFLYKPSSLAEKLRFGRDDGEVSSILVENVAMSGTVTELVRFKADPDGGFRK